ncbi:MAG TPA: hypothetical protein VGC06_09640 [Actinomycetes bacterium]
MDGLDRTLDHLWYRLPDDVLADVLVGALVGLEQVTAGHHADRRTGGVDDRQASDATLVHAPGGFRQGLVSPDGHRRGGHELRHGEAARLALVAAAAPVGQQRGQAVAWRSGLLEVQVALGDDPDDPAGAIDHRQGADVVFAQQPDRVPEAGLLADDDHASGHDVFHGHGHRRLPNPCRPSSRTSLAAAGRSR